LIPVKELKLQKPIEVTWDGPKMPVITLRRPDKVQYDPETRLLHVDTGLDLVLLPLDANSVDRLVLVRSEPTEPIPVTASAPVPVASTQPPKKGSTKK
jgi:hypothetical protein